MVGHAEERGRLPGRIKLILEGGRANSFLMLGTEKSSIALFSTIPVSVINLEPNRELTELHGLGGGNETSCLLLHMHALTLSRKQHHHLMRAH